jgi:histone deacetylase 6
MCYIWDNYLQLYDSVEDIFLMGVGNAYLGIKVLLINRRTFPPTLPNPTQPNPTQPNH